MTHTILIVDDEPTQLTLLAHMVRERLGYEVITISNAEQAVDYILSGREPRPDLVLLDLVMPGMSGLDVIRTVRPLNLNLPIVVVTLYGSMDKAVQAMKLGATDFLAKPVEAERLNVSIQNALRLNHLQGEVERLRRTSDGQVLFCDLVGTHDMIKKAIALGQRAAASDIPVLVEGEAGTGKKLLAKAIHHAGPRSAHPFIEMDCAGLFQRQDIAQAERESLLQKYLSRAGKGTLFLDHVDALPLHSQAQLIKMLHENGNAGLRVIASTCAHLTSLVQGGKFREDLYYRLRTFPIEMPPLRQRRQDIPQLASRFCQLFAAMEDKSILGLTPAAEEMLLQFDWPGNVRQLENALFRAVVLCDGNRLDAHLFRQINHSKANGQSTNGRAGNGLRSVYATMSSLPSIDSGNAGTEYLKMLTADNQVQTIEFMEEQMIRFALDHYRGHISEVARRLGIGRSTLYRKMHEFHIQESGSAKAVA